MENESSLRPDDLTGVSRLNQEGENGLLPASQSQTSSLAYES